MPRVGSIGNKTFAAIHHVGFTNLELGLTFSKAAVWRCLGWHS